MECNSVVADFVLMDALSWERGLLLVRKNTQDPNPGVKSIQLQNQKLKTINLAIHGPSNRNNGPETHMLGNPPQKYQAS